MTAKTDTKTRKPLVVAVLSTGIRVSSAELRGVESAAARAGWTLEMVDPAQTGPDMAPFAPLFARADGVIVRENLHLENAAALLPPETPVVQLDGIHPRADARVRSDVGAETDLAVQELLSLGRRSYVFVPMPKAQRWTAHRARAFLEKMRAAGGDAYVYEPKTDWGWMEEREALAKWLLTLPQPMAILTSTDFLAKFALDACRDAGLDVPGDVAILGSGDDETISRSTKPTLSSIRVDSDGAGRMAVELLGEIMEAGARASSPRKSEVRRPAAPLLGARASSPRTPRALFGRRTERFANTSRKCGWSAFATCWRRPHCPSAPSPNRAASPPGSTFLSSSDAAPARHPASGAARSTAAGDASRVA